MFKVNNKDTRTTPCSSVSIVNFEHLIAGWVVAHERFVYKKACKFKDQSNFLVDFREVCFEIIYEKKFTPKPNYKIIYETLPPFRKSIHRKLH